MKAVILAGGAGTRLWPKSRKFWPKFLLNFGTENSLLQNTFLRLNKIVKKEDIFIVTNKEHKWLVKENIQDLGIVFKEENLITEPDIRNTLPAIAISAKFCLKNYGDDVLGIFPSDHYIKDEKIFCETIKEASNFAQKGYVVIFGIKPSRIETGYGYIEIGEELKVESERLKEKSENLEIGSDELEVKCERLKVESGCDVVESEKLKVEDEKLREKSEKLKVYEVKRFIEKPDIKTAQKLVLQENVYWNSGMFMFKSSVILEEIKNFEPEIFKLVDKWDGDLNKLSSVYKNLKNVSIDKGVIEKTDKLIFVPLEIFWDDVGSWLALERVHKKDCNNNVIVGQHIDIDSNNISVLGNNRLIATAGLKDLIIVDTEDALLVVSKNYTEKVKNLVEQIPSSEVVQYHKTTSRPWGYYTVLEHKNGYKVKLIKVLPKKRLSLQKHKKRDEEWYVVYGKAKIVCGDKEIILTRGESIKISRNIAHRLENLSSKTDLELIEIAHGKYIGEDDIIRLEDDFKR
ncbi:MAG: sugar phosphate nucleotidyltransferase [Endomicrobiia bacterium]